MKKISLPSNINKDSIRSIIIKFREYIKSPDEDKLLKIDMRMVEFVDPAGIVALNNLLRWSENQTDDLQIKFILSLPESCPEKNKQAMEYLADCGFFLNFGFQNPFKTPVLRNTMLKLKNIDSRKFEQWSASDLKNWLRRQTGRKNDFSSVSVAILEIFNNISDHSKQTVGSIYGQFYPKINKVIIAVSDFGIGIPSSIRENFKEKNSLDDNKLIEYALKEGISSRSVPQNRGAGLSNIINTITSNNVGEFTIISNCGKVRVLDGEIKESIILEQPYLGTFFEIIIDTSNEHLYDFEEEEEFTW
ncbi:ATP-binding protein [Streptococcus parauberis]|uniref:ATP-binding protein n=1 Tax=Streptococcus parauberis TaxID=1348 RepID=UPI000CCF55A1|nr:ATP-binding protein [Streptococcus parauberis]PNY18712.1 hypothetical protein ASN86_01666 [Streptococcus parauberis]